jgi:hypothetical protein
MASGQQELVKGKDIQVKNEADGIGLIVFKEEKCESCPPATSQNPREDESLWMVSPQLFSTSDESETKSDESNVTTDDEVDLKWNTETEMDDDERMMSEVKDLMNVTMLEMDDMNTEMWEAKYGSTGRGNNGSEGRRIS